jgi:hypothetical protein
MSIQIRPAALPDGVAVLQLLEDVGYYPDPISFATTYRKTIADPHFVIRVAEGPDGEIVGVATMSLRNQLGLGGLIANLDELATARGYKNVERALLQATVGRARQLGARKVLTVANQNTPPPRAKHDDADADAA